MVASWTQLGPSGPSVGRFSYDGHEGQPMTFLAKMNLHPLVMTNRASHGMSMALIESSMLYRTKKCMVDLSSSLTVSHNQMVISLIIISHPSITIINQY